RIITFQGSIECRRAGTLNVTRRFVNCSPPPRISFPDIRTMHMSDQRIEGAFDQVEGKVKKGLGELTGDTKLKVEGVAKEAGGRAKAAYGRVIDGLDGIADKAHPDIREP